MTRKELVEEYHCHDGYADGCDCDCNYCRECLDNDLADYEKQIREKAIDEFVNFIFAGNVMHNRRFTTREEELFLDMAEKFKHNK